jgi:hypothetical protein
MSGFFTAHVSEFGAKQAWLKIFVVPWIGLNETEADKKRFGPSRSLRVARA